MINKRREDIMNEYEDEIVLMDYPNVLWKRKWLIIIPTFVLVMADRFNT